MGNIVVTWPRTCSAFLDHVLSHTHTRTHTRTHARDSSQVEHIMSEKRLLAEIQFPFIINLYASFKVYTYTYAHICTWYMYIFMFISTYAACRLVKYTHSLVYEVATISSRLPKNIGLFCKEPYKRHYILQKRLIILRSLLIVVTPSHDISFFIHLTPCFNLWNDAFMPMTSDLSIINRCVFSQLHVK